MIRIDCGYKVPTDKVSILHRGISAIPYTISNVDQSSALATSSHLIPELGTPRSQVNKYAFHISTRWASVLSATFRMDTVRHHKERAQSCTANKLTHQQKHHSILCQQPSRYMRRLIAKSRLHHLDNPSRRGLRRPRRLLQPRRHLCRQLPVLQHNAVSQLDATSSRRPKPPQRLHLQQP